MDAHTLLLCWERGRRRHALDRALLMHAAAVPGEDPDTLADRTVGERNVALLKLRQRLFGDELPSCLECPACAERLEFSLSAEALLARSPAGATHVWVDDVRVRVPTTRDLVSVAAETDEASAVRSLIGRLVSDTSTTQWSPAMADSERLTDALDAADPFIDFAIDLTCPACTHAWNAPFDIAAFLWDEIHARARQLLDEVHVLAAKYGWTETEILRLSDTRRAAYIERALA